MEAYGIKFHIMDLFFIWLFWHSIVFMQFSLSLAINAYGIKSKQINQGSDRQNANQEYKNLDFKGHRDKISKFKVHSNLN